MIDDSEDSKQPGLSTERWISFCLGDEHYAIELKRVREIIRISNIVPVPGTPSYVLGITNIRGNVVTVIDGCQRINVAGSPQDDRSRIIILEYADGVIGMVVDSVTDVMDISLSDIDANPKISTHEGARYIKGVVPHNNNLIIILNIDLFLGEECDTAAAAGF